jgi:hypothetical protein
VTTPLLFANLFRWLSPEAFRTLEVTAGRVGAASVTLDPNERADQIHVTDENGLRVPFTVRDRNLQLFASRPSVVRIDSEDRERVVSLTIPDVAEFEWKPVAKTATGLPPAAKFLPASVDLWQWLAVLGGLCIFAEWMLFGRNRMFRRRGATPAGSARLSAEGARDRELVSK